MRVSPWACAVITMVIWGCNCNRTPIRDTNISMAGVWELTMTRDSAPGLPLRGDVALATSVTTTSRTSPANALYRGLYDLDLRSWGINLRVPNQTALATATISNNDSIDIRLNPYIDHVSVHLVGHFSGSKLEGRWYYTAPFGPAGTFTMLPYQASH